MNLTKHGVEININSTIRFKLTESGLKYIQKVNSLDELYQKFPRKWKADKDGWSEDQLWTVMQFFGPAIHLGGEPPFETIICVKY